MRRVLTVTLMGMLISCLSANSLTIDQASKPDKSPQINRLDVRPQELDRRHQIRAEIKSVVAQFKDLINRHQVQLKDRMKTDQENNILEVVTIEAAKVDASTINNFVMSDSFDTLNSLGADLIHEADDKSKGSEQQTNHVEKIFKGKFNDYNGSLLLMTVGLLATGNSLIKSLVGKKVPSYISATLGLGMLVMAQKLSEGENRSSFKSVAGATLFANSLVTLTGMALLGLNANKLTRNMSKDQQIFFANWLYKAKLISLNPGENIDFGADEFKQGSVQKMSKNQVDILLNKKFKPGSLNSIKTTGRVAGISLGVFGLISASFAIKNMVAGVKSIQESKALGLSNDRNYGDLELLHQANVLSQRLILLKTSLVQTSF